MNIYGYISYIIIFIYVYIYLYIFLYDKFFTEYIRRIKIESAIETNNEFVLP